MKHHPCWILIADGARARLFSRETPRGELTLVEAFDNPAARMKTDDLVTGFPGPHGPSDPQSSPGEISEDRFARRLADRLSQGAHRDDFKGLVLVAAPRMLGVLRSKLSRPAKARVSSELARNFTSLSLVEVQREVHAPLG